jgi:hypothetical protein
MVLLSDHYRDRGGGKPKALLCSYCKLRTERSVQLIDEMKHHAMRWLARSIIIDIVISVF